jgi:MFS family permease
MNLKLNKIVKYLIYSDLIFYTGWGLISPIFAIFLIDSIVGGTAFVVGLAAAINLISRSLLRVPFGMAADRSQKRAYRFMFWGLLICAIIPLGYIFSRYPWHIYILQVIFGSAAAMTTAGWTSIFAKYMDRGKESTEWGIDAVAVGIGPGIAAVIGGLAVDYFSFNWVFVAVTIVGLIGVFLLLVVKKDVLKSGKGTGKLFVHHELRRIKKARLN